MKDKIQEKFPMEIKNRKPYQSASDLLDRKLGSIFSINIRLICALLIALGGCFLALVCSGVIQ